MKKSLFTSCLIALCAVACSSENTNCNDSSCSVDEVASDALSTQSQALKTRNFGEIGGDPWNTPQRSYPKTSDTAGRTRFGEQLTVGDFNGDGNPDIATSSFSYDPKAENGLLTIVWSVTQPTAPASTTELNEISVTKNGSITDGMALTSGKFCPDLVANNADMIVMSSPFGGSNGKGAFHLVYRLAKPAIPRVQRTISNLTDDEEVGTDALLVADINGDGKNDLVYQATDINDGSTEIRALLDFCDTSVTTTAKAVTLFGKDDTWTLGSEMHFVDLNGTGSKELVVVDPTYQTADKEEVGAIYFYKYDGSHYVESRPTVYGEILLRKVEGQDTLAPSYGGISSVAFADLNGDGKLDLIVGEPRLYANGVRLSGRVRTYTNLGTSFDTTPAETQKPIWMYDANSSYARFGYKVTVDDLNNDGVPDLIVGAPGERQSTTNPNQRAQSYVYVFLGTKDGSGFSKTPYWTYRSDVATAQNDQFGVSIVAADLDKKGWKDLVIGAHNRVKGSNAYNGAFDVFFNSVAPCYTADKCLIDGVCYDKDELSPDSKCLVCTPTQNNFDFSAVSCSIAESECMFGVAACNDAKGCEAQIKPDGTPCGSQISCDTDTSFASWACKNGTCTKSVTQCADNQSCSDGACKYECDNDDACKDGKICGTNHKCVFPAPTIDEPVSGAVLTNSTVIFSGTAPSGQGVTVNTSADTMNNHNCKATAIDGKWRCSIVLPNDTYHAFAALDSDASLQSEVVSFEVNVSEPEIYSVVITKPANGATITDNYVEFEGTATPDHVITVTASVSTDANQASTCTATADKNGLWDCSIPLNTNKYIAVATDNVDGKEYKSTTVSFNVEMHSPLVLTLDSPKTDEKLINVATFSGKAPAGSRVTVRNSADNSIVCESTIYGTQDWSCKTSLLEPGTYSVFAYVSNSLKTDPVSFQFDKSIPVITTPTTGEKTSIRPTIKGNIPYVEGVVNVWKIDSDVSIRLCTAPITTTGTFACTPGTNLEYETHYVIRASWTDEITQPNYTIYSDVVEFDTDVEPPATIALLTPTTGETLYNSTVIFSGNAEPYSNVTVYWEPVADDGVKACMARANGNGRWACGDVTLTPNTYSAYAVYTDDETVQSERIRFIISDQTPDLPADDGMYETSGGSCSSTPSRHANPHVPWFILACGAGLFIARRRKFSN